MDSTQNPNTLESQTQESVLKSSTHEIKDTASTNTNRARYKEMLIRKTEIIRRYPDTLLLSPDPVGLLEEIFKANRILNLLRKSIIKNKITPDDFLKLQEKYITEVAQPVWGEIVNSFPKFAFESSPIQNWRRFDDSIYEKEILVSRFSKILLTPRSEVVGILGVIHKLLYKLTIEINSTSVGPEAVYKLNEIGNIYREFYKRLKTTNKELITSYSIALPTKKAAYFVEKEDNSTM